MSIKFADTARPNNSTTEAKGTFPVAYAYDVWCSDGDSVEEKLNSITGGTTIQVDVLPPATEALLDTIYQYIGDTDEFYTNGYFYQCQIVDDGQGGTTFGWVVKDVQQVSEPIMNYEPLPGLPYPTAPNDGHFYYNKYGTVIKYLYKTSMSLSLSYISSCTFVLSISPIREDSQTIGYDFRCDVGNLCDIGNEEFVAFDRLKLYETELQVYNNTLDLVATIPITKDAQRIDFKCVVNFLYALPKSSTDKIRMATYEDVQIIQYKEVPYGTIGDVIQYIGPTDDNFTHGHFYEFIDPGSGYLGTWVELPTGDEGGVSTFTGTQAEWDALTEEQKTSYVIANITDDSSSGGGGGGTATINDVDILPVSNVEDAFYRSDSKLYVGDSTDDSTARVAMFDDIPEEVPHWTGTTAQYEANKDNIPEGAYVVLTDDIDQNYESGDYSLDEVNTGNRWIDGKPIYRKVVTGLSVSIPPDTWVSVTSSSNFPNLETIISAKGLANDNVMLLNFDEVQQNNGNLRVEISLGGTRTLRTLILEYTKTTD